MSSEKCIVVAIDGGAASGKSSVSQRISQRNNFLHVDTGSHYRALTRFFLNAEVPHTETDKVIKFLDSLEITSEVRKQRSSIVVNGALEEHLILRAAEVSQNVSLYASIPEVRLKLKNYQRSQKDIASKNGFDGLIMEGRDITTEIFPDADFRFFFSANQDVRIRRRKAEGLQDSVAERDKLDQSRKTAPLKIAEGVQLIDTSSTDVEETYCILCNHIGLQPIQK